MIRTSSLFVLLILTSNIHSESQPLAFYYFG